MMPKNKTSKIVMSAGTIVLGLSMLTTNVYADGDTSTETKVTEKEVCVTQYGGGTECTTEKVEEEITHKRDEVTHSTVDAGINDVNWYGIAGAAGLVALALFGVSKITNGIYWLD